MTDRQTAILESIEAGDFHQAEMYLKAAISRFGKDKRFDTIDGLLKAVLAKLSLKPKAQLKEVGIHHQNGNMVIGLLDHYTKNVEDLQQSFDTAVLSRP